MSEKEADASKTKVRHRTDGGSVVTGPSETLVDNLHDSAEATTVAPPVEEGTVEAHPVEIDQVFKILKNQRRRSVLRYLQTVDDEVRLGTLAEQLAAWECDKDVSQITSSERKRVYVGLYQSHLPKMSDVGAVSYNKPRGKIKPGENRHIFEQYLPTRTDDTEQPWKKYLRTLPLVTALFGLTFVLIWLLV
jgi:hypothetical protein